MNDKLKLPLTAVFSFLLGGVVFFPWAANENIKLENSDDRASTFIFDKISDFDKQKETKKLVVKNGVEKVEYHFSENELKISNLAIKKQLNNFDSVVKTKILEEENKTQTIVASKVIPTIVVEYHFSKDELQQSNLVIKKQLSSYKEIKKDIVVVSTDELPEPEKILKSNKITSVEYTFSNKELKRSNLAITKQLASYIDISDENEQKPVIVKNNDEFEVSEKSESDPYVSDVPEYANEINSEESSDLQDTNKIAKFIESELEKSNLAILKQLKSYHSNNVKNIAAESENISEQEILEDEAANVTGSKEENVSELLISNIAHEDNSKIKSKPEFHKKSKITFNENDFYDENTEHEEDDEEDEYGNERVEFNSEPQYFTESFEVKSVTTTKDKNETFSVEDIVEDSNSETTISEIEIIEEIEISDDGKVIASSVDN